MIKGNALFTYKIRAVLVAACLCASVLAGCGSTGSANSTGGTTTGTTSTATTGSNSTTTDNSVKTVSTSPVSVTYDTEDADDSWDSAKAATIALDGGTITSSGTGAVVNGSTVTIKAAGTYVISGTLTDGQIIVDTDDKDPVRLVLNGVDLTCSNSAAINIQNAQKVILILSKGTENKITCGEKFEFSDQENEEPNAAIFSKSDLTLNGSGSLAVTAEYGHGIFSKDELKIMSGNLTVKSAADGIKGRDYVAIKDGTITVDAASDGIQASNDEDTGMGYVIIDGGTIKITAGLDGIQAETGVAVNGGSISIVTGGGSANGISKNNDQPGFDKGFMKPGSDPATAATTETAADTSDSFKGTAAAGSITVSGGTLTIDSADDALHSNAILVINGGGLNLTSGDDGIHADTSIEINGGTIKITKSYEAIESALITVNDGSLNMVSSDDGFNVAGGNDGSSMNGRPGQNTITETGNYYLNINGGYIVMDAGGDGLDSNGSITMTAGTVLVSGPTENNNGAIDYNGTFKMTGGFLAAAGSSGMAEAPDSSSTQYAMLVGLTASQSAGTLVNIQNAAGESILTFKPTKAYSSIVFCSPDLEKGATYKFSTGGSSTGTEKDGLYTGGTYSGGTEQASVTLSSGITTSGSTGGMGGGGGGGGGQKPGGFGGRR